MVMNSGPWNGSKQVFNYLIYHLQTYKKKTLDQKVQKKNLPIPLTKKNLLIIKSDFS